MSPNRERLSQKRRTREAILAGARALIERGEAVNVTAAAAESGISKATAYRYFSDPAVLVAEAGLAVEVRPYEEIVAGAEGPRARAVAVSLYFFDLAVAHEPAFRQFLARNLDCWLAEGGSDKALRGARRVAMLELALDELRGTMPPRRFGMMIGALSVAAGAEALIALCDVARLSPQMARETVAELTHAVLDRFMGSESPAAG
ncbi:TetR/AcrR family transcriptional regulator [Stappia sp.]|uniref:TetR/AcrR family transcriptional regulator n=1 Tax=Stappia sp. TaxID=1870903 RepID=UPI003A9922E6